MNEWLILLWGFCAQLIDGTLGMGYGVTASSLLLLLSISPVVVSASIHAAEVFTSLISGVSHFSLGNVRKDLIRLMLLPGMLGGVSGAILLSIMTIGRAAEWVSCILIAMGILVVGKALFIYETALEGKALPGLVGLAFMGGFLDAAGGGGWGPVMSPSLLLSGVSPKDSIGTTNLIEFFVTVAEVATFAFMVGLEVFDLRIVVPLMIGGAIAAPIAAWLCNKLPARALGVIVGLTLIVLNIRRLMGL